MIGGPRFDRATPPMIRFFVPHALAVILTTAALATPSQAPPHDVVTVLRPFVRATDAELKRLEKQLAEKRNQLEGIRAKLANEGFVSRAPADVVAQQRELVADLEKQIASIEETIRELKA